MPHNCFVPLSNNNTRTRIRKDEKSKIRRDEGLFSTVTNNTGVCSMHFCEEDYTASEGGKGKKTFLKKRCCPVYFSVVQLKNGPGLL